MTVRESYQFLKTRWGLYRFLALFLLSSALAVLVLQNPRIYAPIFKHDRAFSVSVVLVLLMFGVGFASYQRIQKFKPFLTAHLYLTTGLIYLYVIRYAFGPKGALLTMESLHRVDGITALHVLLGFMSMNLLVVVASPPSLRYRATRLWALLIAVGEAALYFVVLRNLDRGTASMLLVQGPGFIASVTLINLAAFALSILLLKEENSFGGVIAALAVIHLFAAHSLESPPFTLAGALFFTLPVYVLLGTVLFWFSCLHYRVAYDPLLQIYNRDYAHNIVSGLSHIALTRTYCVAMIDIDRFKAVNDTWGHQVGDEVLRGTAQVIKSLVVPSGVACRYGGEEIIVFFRGLRENDAFALCDEIRRGVWRKKYVAGGREFAVSVSIGIAECDDIEVPIERVVKAADEALYKAKETGRNKVLIGRAKKRLHDTDRPTYRFMKLSGADRRKEPDPAKPERIEKKDRV